MLEDLRERVLVHLEERVERAIDLIHRLREDKSGLNAEIRRLHDVIRERDETIQVFEAQKDELTRVQSELQALQGKREQELQEVDREKTEIRERLEGLMSLLNAIDQDKHEDEEPPDAPTDSENAAGSEECRVKSEE